MNTAGEKSVKSRFPVSLSVSQARWGVARGTTVSAAQATSNRPLARNSSSIQRGTPPSGLRGASPGRRVFVFVSAVSVCGNQ